MRGAHNSTQSRKPLKNPKPSLKTPKQNKSLCLLSPCQCWSRALTPHGAHCPHVSGRAYDLLRRELVPDDLQAQRSDTTRKKQKHSYRDPERAWELTSTFCFGLAMHEESPVNEESQLPEVQELPGAVVHVGTCATSLPPSLPLPPPFSALLLPPFSFPWPHDTTRTDAALVALDYILAAQAWTPFFLLRADCVNVCCSRGLFGAAPMRAEGASSVTSSLRTFRRCASSFRHGARARS